MRRHRGLTLIELLVVIAIMAILIALILAGVQKVREAAARAKCQHHLRQSALALQQHHDVHRAFPQGHRPPRIFQEHPLSGWPLSILPYLEQQAVADQANVAYRAKWIPFAPNPHPGLGTVVPVFTCPSDGRLATAQVSRRTNTLAAFTSYLGVAGRSAFDGRDGLLYQASRTNHADIADGPATRCCSASDHQAPISNSDGGTRERGSGSRVPRTWCSEFASQTCSRSRPVRRAGRGTIRSDRRPG